MVAQVKCKITLPDHGFFDINEDKRNRFPLLKKFILKEKKCP